MHHVQRLLEQPLLAQVARLTLELPTLFERLTPGQFGSPSERLACVTVESRFREYRSKVVLTRSGDRWASEMSFNTTVVLNEWLATVLKVFPLNRAKVMVSASAASATQWQEELLAVLKTQAGSEVSLTIG